MESRQWDGLRTGGRGGYGWAVVRVEMDRRRRWVGVGTCVR